MESEKSITSFKMKKGMLPEHLSNIFFYLFVNKFSALLLCKINVLDIFNMGDFFQIFVISRTIEILIESNFWLGTYLPQILEGAKTIYFMY